MLYLVKPKLHHLRGSHESGNVTAHAQPALVRCVNDHRDELWFHRAVNLDLLETEIRVPIYSRSYFGFVTGKYAGRNLERTRRIDQSRENEPRTDKRTIVELFLQIELSRRVVPHVTRARHASGDVEQSILVGRDVHVHIPQSRQQRFPPCIDHFSSSGRLYASIRPDPPDSHSNDYASLVRN